MTAPGGESIGAETAMELEVRTLEERIEHHASRLEELQGEANKRVRKRVLATLGKLKKELQTKRLKLEENSTSISTNKVSKKKLKNKVNLLNQEIQELAQKKCLHLALKKFQQGKRKGYPLNIHSYSNLLNAYVRCVDLSGAEALLNQMFEQNIESNVVLWTILLKGYAEIGNLHEMNQILYVRMKEHNVEPNLRTLHTYLRGCHRIGAVQSAYSLFDAYRSQIDFDWSCLRYIIQLQCQALHVEKGMEILSEYSDKLPQSPLDTSLIYLSLCRSLLLKGRTNTPTILLLTIYRRRFLRKYKMVRLIKIFVE